MKTSEFYSNWISKLQLFLEFVEQSIVGAVVEKEILAASFESEDFRETLPDFSIPSRYMEFWNYGAIQVHFSFYLEITQSVEYKFPRYFKKMRARLSGGITFVPPDGIQYLERMKHYIISNLRMNGENADEDLKAIDLIRNCVPFAQLPCGDLIAFESNTSSGGKILFISGLNGKIWPLTETFFEFLEVFENSLYTYPDKLLYYWGSEFKFSQADSVRLRSLVCYDG